MEIQHNEVFDLAYRFVTETSENIFLTGKAGTGKTTFLKYLRENCNKNIVVAAPTGVAAINAGGVTLHSLFHLPFEPYIPTEINRSALLGRIKFHRQRQELLRKMELLVIDEISMVRCDTMDAIDAILRSVRRRHDVAFGGVQLLFIGDLFQLPPVAPPEDLNILRNYYSSEFFFDSLVIRDQMPLLIELNTIYRQKENRFVQILNKVRNSEMSSEDFQQLHERYNPEFRPDSQDNFITLTSHNNQADLINYRELHKLTTPPLTYEAEIEGDFPEKSYPAEALLTLKPGSQVMFLKNDVINRKYFNGKIGVVKYLYPDEVIVTCGNEDITVRTEDWENVRYSVNKDGKLEQEVMGRFTQFPLRLAWAITIHKSQGLTFERVMIDAASAFSSGQVYVALSRCTSLDGIILLSKIPSAAIFCNQNVLLGHQQLTPKSPLAQRFEGARQIFTQQILEEIFSFSDTGKSVDHLYYRIHEHKDKLNNQATEWIRLLKDDVLRIKHIGKKFIHEVNSLMKSAPIIEENNKLRERITVASNHFLPIVEGWLRSVKSNPVVTEHREAAVPLDGALNDLFTQLNILYHYLEYCKEPFSITGFLQQKLKMQVPKGNISSYAAGKKESASDVSHSELYDLLKQWRDDICDRKNIAIYKVASQNTLKEIAQYLPQNPKDLQKINGFGKIKTAQYGEEILSIVNEYCDKYQLETNAGDLKEKVEKVRKPKSAENFVPTYEVTLKLFEEGKSIPEIAQIRNMVPGTIESHLERFVKSGRIELHQFVSEEAQQKILEAIKIHGRESLKTLKENLPDDITYSQIRMVTASLRKKPEGGEENNS